MNGSLQCKVVCSMLLLYPSLEGLGITFSARLGILCDVTLLLQILLMEITVKDCISLDMPQLQFISQL